MRAGGRATLTQEGAAAARRSSWRPGLVARCVRNVMRPCVAASDKCWELFRSESSQVAECVQAGAGDHLGVDPASGKMMHTSSRRATCRRDGRVAARSDSEPHL
eukprot:scaffold469_cov391-Prasinococcus_capsulatus_cf.AAC.8